LSNMIRIDGFAINMDDPRLVWAVYRVVEAVVRAGAHETLRLTGQSSDGDEVTTLVHITPTTTLEAVVVMTGVDSPRDELVANLDTLRDKYIGDAGGSAYDDGRLIVI
jgi:hypothetical protein